MTDYDDLRSDLHEAVAAMSSYAAAVNRKEDAVTVELERLWTDNAELRDEVLALANRLEALTHFVTTSPAEVAAKIVDGKYELRGLDNA